LRFRYLLYLWPYVVYTVPTYHWSKKCHFQKLGLIFNRSFFTVKKNVISSFFQTYSSGMNSDEPEDIFFNCRLFLFFRAVSNNKQPFSIIWQKCSNLSPFTNMAPKGCNLCQNNVDLIVWREKSHSGPNGFLSEDC
jgi:hypothetical protein